jgi:hypothetical protein
MMLAGSLGSVSDELSLSPLSSSLYIIYIIRLDIIYKEEKETLMKAFRIRHIQQKMITRP